MNINTAELQTRSFLIIIKSVSRFSKKIFINNQNRAGMDISDLLKLPANVYWKNRDGFYLGCNDTKAQAACFHSRSDIIGTKIQDYVKKNNAELVEKIDQLVMGSNIVQYKIECADFIHPKSYIRDPQLSTYISIKQPLYNLSGIVIGMLGVSINFKLLPYIDWSQFRELLSKDGLSNIEQAITSHLFKQQAELESLTNREKQCLFYISRGRSIKEIARLLQLSQKTVEYYRDNVKVKLNSTIKSEIIDKYLQYNLLWH